MRSNRPSAAATAHKPYASHTPCEHQFRCSHGVCDACALRAAAVAHGRFDRITTHGFENRA
eukprot:9990144-Lingulodinium_polyedra.AAC.1